MKKIILIISVVSLIITTCSENPTGSELEDEFSFEINVTGSDSKPLSGLLVSVWNKFPFLYHSNYKQNSPNKITASTSFRFSIPRDSFVEIQLYDLENSLYETIINNDSLRAGVYIYHFNYQNNFGTTVYKCKMIAKDERTINNISFQDSIYCVLVSPDIYVAKVGETNLTGNFTTKNKLLFPNLYALPELVRTNELGPEVLGTFTIPDTIRIALKDTLSGNIQYFDRLIKEGENIFDLVWGTGVQQNNALKVSPTLSAGFNKVKDETTIVPTIPTEFKLYQNFPNPFN